MSAENPNQAASRDLWEAVRADPELRAQFEAYAERTRTTEPVPDDLSWVRDSLPAATPLHETRDYSQRAYDVVSRATSRHED